MRNPLHPILIVLLCALGLVATSARAAEPNDARADEYRPKKLQPVPDQSDTTGDKIKSKIQKAPAKPATDKVPKTPAGKLPKAGQPPQKKYVHAADAAMEPEDVAGRVKHLRTAAQHLKAAGKPDLSSKLWAEAGQLEKTTKPAARGSIKKGSSGASDRTSDIAAELTALQLEVQRLKAELAALRKPSK